MIDNKRLFVVQSRGELREGSERQVCLHHKISEINENGKDDDDLMISMNRNLRSRFTRVCRSCGEEGRLEFKTLFDCR